jgi:thiol-disulfide isomerase/thioredoxin
VVLVDFWTYTCINCIRTLPYLNAWYARYHSQGFQIVGVHTPEFPFEHSAANVASAIAQNGIRYPVTQDNDYSTWNAYNNEYWPAEYLIDAQGRIRLVDFGEGEYPAKERAIRSLLAEAGASRLGTPVRVHAQQPPEAQVTPESYLAGADVRAGIAHVKADRLYRLVGPAGSADPHADRAAVQGCRGLRLHIRLSRLQPFYGQAAAATRAVRSALRRSPCLRAHQACWRAETGEPAPAGERRSAQPPRAAPRAEGSARSGDGLRT